MPVFQTPLNRVVISGVLQAALTRGINNGVKWAEILAEKQLDAHYQSSFRLKLLLTNINAGIAFYEGLGFGSPKVVKKVVLNGTVERYGEIALEPPCSLISPTEKILKALKQPAHQYNEADFILKNLESDFEFSKLEPKKDIEAYGVVALWRAEVLENYYSELSLILGCLWAGGLPGGEYLIFQNPKYPCPFWGKFYYETPHPRIWTIVLEECDSRINAP